MDVWKAKLQSNDGASLIASLLFFVFCGVCASMILSAASASAGKMHPIPISDQKRLVVESAAAFLRDELTSTENTVKIKEVMISDSRTSDATNEIHYYYVGSSKNTNDEQLWQEFKSGTQSAILDSFIQDHYISMIHEHENSSVSRSSEKNFTLSVQQTKGTNSYEPEVLKANVCLSMDSDYKIHAIISDSITDYSKEEDRCERILTLPSELTKETSVDVESHEILDSDGYILEVWSITTTTRLTTISWKWGVIEKKR